MRQWKHAFFWFALALIGQAIALRLIDAGTRLHYQHYLSLPRQIAERPIELAVLALQTALVLVGFRSRWLVTRDWLRRRFRVWQIAVIGLVFFLTSATVSEDIGFYFAELVFATFVQAVALANIVLFALSVPQAQLSRFASWFGDKRGRGLDRYAVVGAIWVTVAAALLSYFSYERHPHIPDEVVYLLHARYFAAGKLALPLPPVPQAFDVDLMDADGDRWFSTVPPGWPAVLAVGDFFGVPWLVNPILGGLCVLLAFWLVQELYDRPTARLALLLIATSPWHVFLAMSYMTHTVSLTLALVAAVAALLARRGGNAVWALAAGLATGGVAMVRPLEGFTCAVVLGLCMLVGRSKRLQLGPVVAFVVGGAALGGLALYYNKLISGDPRVFPIMAYMDKHYGRNSNTLGFGPNRGVGWAIDPYPGHSPRDAMINANLNAFSINIELFGWGLGSLLPATLFVLAGKPRGPDLLMVGIIAAVFAVHFFYYFSGGPDFGARYWYLMFVPLVVLSVRAILCLGDGRVLPAVIALCVLTVLNYFPWRAIDKYHHYEGMRADIRDLADRHQFGKSLVLVKGARHPDYASAAIYNPLDLQAGVPIYAWDRSLEVRKQVIDVYRDRSIWLVDGPTVTGEGFRVAAGPISADVALSR